MDQDPQHELEEVVPPSCIIGTGCGCRPGSSLMWNSTRDFNSILDSISDGVIVVNRELVISYFNRAAEKLLGRLRDDVLGKPMFSGVFPEAAGSIFERRYRKALLSGRSTEFETWFGVAPYANWYEVRAYPFDGGLTIIFRVTTNRKLAEEALVRESRISTMMADLSREIISKKSLAEISSQVLVHGQIFCSSPVGLLGYVDREIERLVCPAVEGLEGPARADLHHTLEFRLDSRFCDWISRRSGPLAIEDPGDCSDIPRLPGGHPKLNRFIISPVFAAGHWLGVVVLANAPKPYCQREIDLVEQLSSLYGLAIQRGLVWRDLQQAQKFLEQRVEERTAMLAAAYERLRMESAEREEAEEKRRLAEAELAAQKALSMRSDRLRSLGEMAAGIAHELNQPLVGVRGLAEHLLLSRERGWQVRPNELEERLSLILEQADRMSHIIDHVRMFARDAGKPETRLTDAREVVRSALNMVGEQFRAAGLNVELDLATDEASVTVNPFSLEEVVLNLLTNARDALLGRTGTGNGDTPETITIRCRTEWGQDGHSVLITVSEGGVGIAPDDLDRVFEPFFTTKDPNNGTGLGLSICRTIVEQFGGEISISSVLGAGTTVTVSLPQTGDPNPPGSPDLPEAGPSLERAL